MKTLVLLLLICVCPVVTRAQNAPVIARAAALRDAGNFDDAQQLLDAELAQAKAGAECDDLRNALADVHFYRAEKLRGDYDFQNAIAYYFQSYATDKMLRHSDAAIDLNNIGLSYWRLSRYEDALRYFEQALPLRREVKDRKGEAITLNYIGAANLGLSRYDEALRYYHQALPIYREVQDRQGEAVTLGNIGSANQRLNRTDDALNTYQQALQLQREIKDRAGEATMLSNIGTVYQSLGRADDALNYYEQALPIRRETKDRLGEAVTLGSIGAAYESLSRYEDALNYFEQALPIRRAVKDRNGEAVLLGDMGLAYQNLSRTDDAVAYGQQSLAIYREVKDRRGEATALLNIGLAQDKLGQYEEALRDYNQALSLSREVKDRQIEAATLNSIGGTYHNLQRYDDALTNYAGALQLQYSIKDQLGEASTLSNIGAAYERLSRYAESLRYYELALLLRRAIKDRQGEAVTLNNMMFVYQAQKQPELAIFYGKQAVNVTQSIRRDMRKLDKISRAAYIKGNDVPYQTLSRLLIGTGRFAEAEQVLAMLQQDEFLDFVRRDARGVKMETLDSDFVGAEQTVVAEQNTRVESVAKLSAEAFTLGDLEAPTPEQSARLIEVQASLKAARTQLNAFFDAMPARFARNAADVAVDRNELSTIVPLLREMGQQSNSKVALISAFVDDKGLELLLTLPSGQTVNLSYAADEKLQNGQAFPAWLNAHIFDFKSAIEKRAPVENAATALWNVVGCKGALSAQLEGAQIDTIMWRLTGPLRAIPLAALRDKDGYLVEKYRNVVLTAGSSELNLAHQPVGDWRALGVGVTKAWTIGGDQFSALSGVEGELQAVMDAPDDGFRGGVLPGRVLQDEKFSEANFFRTLRGADAEANSPWQVIHIASHFKLAGDNLQSFLLTGDGKALTIADLQERAQESPLFPGVELMTLSACDTASGGQGADSLGALAELNGARSVLATLWPVADHETAQLMADFYANHAATPSAGKAVALQKAQLKLLHAGGVAAHPYYWAPFVLMGNWR